MKFQDYEFHRLLRCTACQLVFQAPEAADAALEMIPQIYDDAWVEFRDQASLQTFLEHAVFQSTLLGMFRTSAGNLLEIGSGTGEFAYMAQSAGWHVTGVEPSAAACRYARSQFGLELVNAPWRFDLPQAEQRYDAIAFWHVLEHIADPICFLRGLAGLLSDDGLLLFAVPNLRSLTNAICREGSPLFTERDHLFHFAPSHIERLLDLAGLAPLTLFSRQEPARMETDLTLGRRYASGFENVGTVQALGLLSNLQGRLEGHELFCVARRT